MPPRLARSSVSQSFSSKPTSARRNTKRKSRTQDAFSIAAATDADHVKVRQHRLGESELDADEPRHKRQRMLDEDEDDEDDVNPASEARRRQQKIISKGERGPGGFAEEDEVSGSDGEGNHWRIGAGDEDDEDASVDSDEAFGESDEEKFEDFTFRGSKAMQGRRRKLVGHTGRDDDEDGGVNLDEGGNMQDDDGSASDDSLGSDAVDLATALDQAEDDDEDEGEEEERQVDEGEDQRINKAGPTSLSAIDDDFAQFSESDASDDGFQHNLESDEDDEESSNTDEESSNTDEEVSGQRPSKSIQDIASSFAKGDGESGAVGERRRSNLGARSFFDVLNALTGNDSKSSKKRKDEIALPGSLPKRQQDQVDRKAAYKKAKETLDRWQDTVKHNRRAEHLHFPLVDPDEQHPQGENKLMPATTTQPRNELESAIEGILQDSGLATSLKKQQKDEEAAGEGDELPTQKKMSKREERARLLELRKAREMIFREEQRAKRIKKIKSKAYRRIHRKERDRDDQAERAERQELVERGLLSEDEDEREKHDRRRAEERMGNRHKNSRWAKSVKATGRAGWDDDTRAAMESANLRDQDLRTRVLPREDSSDESIEDMDSDNEDTQFRLREKVDELDAPGEEEPKSKLASLKFMQRADEAQRKRNEEDIQRLRKDLDNSGEASDSEPEVNMGRRIFGPQQSQAQSQKPAVKRNELEEPESDEDGSTGEGILEDSTTAEKSNEESRQGATKQGSKERLRRPPKAASQVPVIEPDRSSIPSPEPVSSKDKGAINTPSTKKSVKADDKTPAEINGFKTVSFSLPSTPAEDQVELKVNGNDAHSDDETANDAALTLTPGNTAQQSLVEEAFGVDETADKAFEQEKRQAEESEDDHFESTALPGWGSWAGEGLSKRAQQHAAQRKAQLMKKSRGGVGKEKRKDKGKQNVILSEKKVRKNGKYRADQLPHPFESKAQYERSLRVPVGPEWTTKESFQKNTTPRVMVKQGIIKPMRKPLM